jgi:hypothetical protein
MSRHLFFEASRQTYKQVTEIFDFLWPTAAAMWNLRWQVDGYLRVCPTASSNEIEGRFVNGSGIHGANIKRACVDLSWQEQQEEFAKFLLINIIALYESWAKQILKNLGRSNASHEKGLQFPTRVKPNGSKSGVWAVIDDLTRTESAIVKSSFYNLLILHNKNSKDTLDNLLKCYRYFKECRNCLVHAGGVASRDAEDAYTDFVAVATTADLGLSEVPHHLPIAIGDEIHLNLRGIVGLCGVIMRLVATIDAELARADSAERVFLDGWVNKHGKNRIILRARGTKRRLKISRLLSKLGLPTPSPIAQIENYLVGNSLVF